MKEVLSYYRERGFEPVVVKGNKGLGCNEFVLRKQNTTSTAALENTRDEG